MIALNENIGRIIVGVNLDRQFAKANSFELEIDTLIDLIKVRIKDRSIDEISNRLLEHLFELRVSMMNWMKLQKINLSDYQSIIERNIEVNVENSSFSNLDRVVTNSLIDYEKIISPFLSKLPDLKGFHLNYQQNKIQYNSFKSFAFHPYPRIKFLKQWLDSSLKLDLGLIISDLILTNQIHLTEERVQTEVIEFIKGEIIKFGAYSIFTGFWIPKKDDLSDSTNKMKILAATIEMDHKIMFKTTKESISTFIQN